MDQAKLQKGEVISPGSGKKTKSRLAWRDFSIHKRCPTA